MRPCHVMSVDHEAPTIDNCVAAPAAAVLRRARKKKV
jgi:hypothetical protein